MMARVLVADDESSVRELIRYTLERNGHEVLESGTGTDTLARLKESPDLLILDVMLPGMDGYTLQLQMAQDERQSRIPVIVLTALENARSLFDKFPQVKAYVTKPFDPHEMARLAESILNK